MIFTPTPLGGAWLVDIEPWEDERGFFARTWCLREFEERGLDARVVQCSVARTRRRGTLRGLHWQVPPHEEIKLVTCTRGAIWDVIVDLRPESPTYTRWYGVELNAETRRTLYVPARCAHGFVTLVDDVDVQYQMSDWHAADAQRGVRWNDPAFAIDWPVQGGPILNERDAGFPDFLPERVP
jgi:dTDP-4-dehydrorhamnose 3,5-epimerase